MDWALPDALVAGHRRHIPAVSMPDPKDRHVVAAAIEAGAQAVVSADRHFRDGGLKPHGLAVWRPGDFRMRLYRADPGATVACMTNARRNLRRSAPTAAEFVADLRRIGKLDEFCSALDRHLSDL
jgi:hypothetical protein